MPMGTCTTMACPMHAFRYMLEWVKGAKSEYGLDIDYLGTATSTLL